MPTLSLPLFQPPSTPMRRPAWLLLWSGSSMPCLRLAWLPCHVSRPLGFCDGRESGETTPAVWCGVVCRKEQAAIRPSPTPARNQSCLPVAPIF